MWKNDAFSFVNILELARNFDWVLQTFEILCQFIENSFERRRENHSHGKTMPSRLLTLELAKFRPIVSYTFYQFPNSRIFEIIGANLWSILSKFEINFKSMRRGDRSHEKIFSSVNTLELARNFDRLLQTLEILRGFFRNSKFISN